MTIQEPTTHIVIRNDIPRTANRNVKVRMIAQMYTHGQTANDVAEHYGISLADVHAALAYYYDNQSYFDAIDKRNAALREKHGISAVEHREQMRSKSE